MNRSSIGCFLLVIFSFLLTGCDPSAGYPDYVVRYSSGAEIDGYGQEPRAIEGSDLLIDSELIKMKRGDDTEYVDYVNVQDEEENIIYTLEMERNYSFYTGQMIDGTLWICGEEWSTPHGGRIDNYLEAGRLCGINMETETIEHDQTLGKNELFLTVRGEYAYFYHRGKKGTRYFGGLYQEEDQNARVYRRALSNGEEIQNVYELDYAEEPEDIYFTKIVFELQEEKIVVVMARYGKKRMENKETFGNWIWIKGGFGTGNSMNATADRLQGWHY